MGEYTQIQYRTEGRLARIVLDRPQYRNAQSRVLLTELDAAFTAAAADDGVRVIILSGNGPAFSAGHDLGTPEEAADRARRARDDETETETQFRYSWDHFLDLSLRWRDLPKPTIAAVHGWCIFGGWLIASAMDLVVAADDARFLTALLQYFPLPFDVGPRKAKELLFDSRPLSALEAQELGFVNRVVPADRLEEEVVALATRIAENNAFYLRLAKLAVNSSQDAMGFRTAVQGAHSHYQLSQVANAQWRKRREQRGEPAADPHVTRRMPLVAKVLARDAAEEDGRP
ncbi:MAG TPA: enoyl-CoA hydratase-related protein [Acidimicrobiales bacterium]|nr:enoyl-CoA hydratase-related protein [Acidimicrobiales bacterium]